MLFKTMYLMFLFDEVIMNSANLEYATVRGPPEFEDSKLRLQYSLPMSPI